MKVLEILDFEHFAAQFFLNQGNLESLQKFDFSEFPILVVDDEAQNLLTFKANFRKKFKVDTAQSAIEALEMLSKKNYSVVVTDQRMPQMSGLDFLKIIKEKYPKVTRMMLTGFNDPDVTISAVNEGSIFRFILKPWNADEMQMHLIQSIEYYVMKVSGEELVEQLDKSLFQMIKAFAMAVDAKDDYTRTHSGRVSELATRIGKEMGLDKTTLKRLRIAGLLHDVGKIGIPEAILNKPSGLTEEEFKIIKTHPAMSRAILQNIKVLKTIAKIAGGHHERYDGKGYPLGIAGEEIPLESRILAIADTFDSMFLDRKYRKGLSIKVIINELEKFSGHQFDPQLVGVLLKMIEKEFGRSIAYLKEHDLEAEEEVRMRKKFDMDTHLSVLLVDEEEEG